MRFHLVAEAGKVLFSLAFVAACATRVAGQSGTPIPAEVPPPVAIGPGDAAISGFSGVGLADATLPPGVNPLDKTVITVANPSLKILDLSFVGGEAAGQLLPPNVKFSVPARDIGQVFGLAFDTGSGGGPPNVYAAATSLYVTLLIAIAFCAATFFGAEAQTRGIGIGIGTGMMILNGLSKSAKSGGKSKSTASSKSKKKYAAKKKGSGSKGKTDDDDAPARAESEPAIESATAAKPDAVPAAAAAPAPNAGTAAAAGGAAAIATGAAAGEATAIASNSEIKAAQQHLQYMGYDVRDVSGTLDLKTKIAIMQFQDSIGESSTGILTVKQLQTLFLKASERTATTK